MQAVFRTLSGAASAAGVSAHGDSLLVLLDVLEEGDGAGQLPAVDGLGGLTGVLERDTQVLAAGASRLGGRNLGGGVSNLFHQRGSVSLQCPHARTKSSKSNCSP